MNEGSDTVGDKTGLLSQPGPVSQSRHHPEAQLFLDTRTRGNLFGIEGCSPETKLGVGAPSVQIPTVLLRERGPLRQTSRAWCSGVW